MVDAFLLIAAEAAHHPSKAPFYIVGGALAVWAVVLSAIGLSRPDFPSTTVAARGAMGISAALVVAAMAMALVTA